MIITLGSFLYLRICRQESSPYGLSIGNRVQVATGTFAAKSLKISDSCLTSCVSLRLKSVTNLCGESLAWAPRHRRTGTAHKGTDRGMCSGSPYGGGEKKRKSAFQVDEVAYGEMKLQGCPNFP